MYKFAGRKPLQAVPTLFDYQNHKICLRPGQTARMFLQFDEFSEFKIMISRKFEIFTKIFSSKTCWNTI